MIFQYEPVMNYIIHSVPTFDDMDFSAYPALDTAIQISEENLCSPISCDPHSQWRSVDGTCNNLVNPRWGAANEAQNRIVSAEWEEGMCIKLIDIQKAV